MPASLPVKRSGRVGWSSASGALSWYPLKGPPRARKLRAALLGRAPLALGEPCCETPARGVQPRRELGVERCNLAAKLKEPEVEQSLSVTHMGAGRGALDRCAALGAGHVARLRGRTEHDHPSADSLGSNSPG
jgi:hypothetical protein